MNSNLKGHHKGYIYERITKGTMKKRIITISMIMGLTLLTACGKQATTSETEVQPERPQGWIRKKL